MTSAAAPSGAPTDSTLDERDAFLESHRHLVGYVVDRLHVSITSVFDHEDAMQAGLLALLAARDTYRADRGASFETYAILRIRGAILDAVRSLDPLGRHGRDAARAIAVTSNALLATLGRDPTDAEIADRLGLTTERCVELRRAASISTVSLDGQSDDASERTHALNDTLLDPQAVDPPTRAAKREELSALVHEVAMLGDRNQRVIALYYRDELTFREIASVLGVSESRACQIHRSALGRLRERLAPRGATGHLGLAPSA